MDDRGTRGSPNYRQECRGDSRTVGGKEGDKCVYGWGWCREIIWEGSSFEPPAVRIGMESHIQSCPPPPSSGWLHSASTQPRSRCTGSPHTPEASSVSSGGLGRALFLSMSCSFSCIHGPTLGLGQIFLCLPHPIFVERECVCIRPRRTGAL